MNSIEAATALLDEVISGWITPDKSSNQSNFYNLRPEELLRIAALCGSLEGTVYGERLQFTLGDRARKVYSVPDAVGKLRSALARLATIIDEIRHPELLEITGNSAEQERRKYKLRQNNVHGFQTTFDFPWNNGSILLHAETSNGMPLTGNISGFGFIIRKAI
jgi:hypothetical protein